MIAAKVQRKNAKKTLKDGSAPLILEIKSFDTQCNSEFLYIYDGEDVYGRQIAALR